MPELPEVEVVRRGLASQIEGEEIQNLAIYHPRPLRDTTPESLTGAVIGNKISAVVRRGKFMWWLLSAPTDSLGRLDSSAPAPVKNQAVLVHLGMSGQMLVHTKEADNTALLKHTRLKFWLTNGKTVSFVDQRIFGRLQAVELAATSDGEPGGWGSGQKLIPTGLEKTLARDALDPAVNWEQVVSTIQKRKIPIKNILLDQQIVSGIGNIYADEALHAAQLNPLVPGKRLTAETIYRVYQNAATVMKRALAEGGTSFDALYVDANGNPGYFARSLQCYGRAGQACYTCETPLIQIRLSGRSATFCPHCQCGPGRHRV